MIKTLSSKIFTYICLLLVIGVGFFGDVSLQGGLIEMQGVSESYAAEGCTPGVAGCPADPATNQANEKKMQEMLQGIVNAINIALDILTIIVTPAIILASWLMSPDWTSGDLFQIRPVIHDLWIMVSNVTYFIYAILLIFIALATIFNSQNYGYKVLLPKLALGIILVPLTWWFVQFIISLATVVTASVINIPNEVVINYNKTNQSSWWTTPSIPKEIVYENDKTTINNLNSEDKTNKCADSTKCVSPEQFLAKSGGMYSSLMIYSFSVFKLQDIKQLTSTFDITKGIGQIVNQLIIGALMFIVFGLLVIALIFMLLMRAIKLWFYAIFSPLMTLKYVLGDGVFGKESGESFEIKEFIGLAFVPAVVGLALSFGLVIVSMMIKPMPSTTPDCGPTNCTITLFGNPENTINTTVADKISSTTFKVGDVSYKFNGTVSSSNATGNVVSALDRTAGIIGTIIIDIIALIFIWVAFMAAKGVSKVAATAFAPFEELGKKVGGMAASLPKYTPIPFTGGMSVSTGTKTLEMAQNAFITEQDKKSMTKISKLFPGIVQGVIKPEDMARLQDIITKKPDGDVGMKQILQTVAEVQSKGDKNSANHNSIAERTGDLMTTRGEALHRALRNATSDTKEIEIMKKFLTNDKNMSSTEKDKAYEFIQKYFGSAGNTSGANASNPTFNIKVDSKGQFEVSGEGIATEKLSKDALFNALKGQYLNEIKTLSDDNIKAELKGRLSDDQINQILDVVKKARESNTKKS